MLAVQPTMDALRRSSHGTDRHSLLREPSAEDLDAARQLVSSARGEMIRTPSVHDGQVSDTSEISGGQSVRDAEPANQQRAASEATERSTSSNFGQVCRYVPYAPSHSPFGPTLLDLTSGP